MKTIKPLKLKANKMNTSEELTSAEMGKLWAIYMGNSMANCILSYYLRHVEDDEIKTLLENAQKLTTEFMKTIKEIFEKENSYWRLPKLQKMKRFGNCLKKGET